MEKYKDFWEKGMYKCNKCGNKLFSSEAKFNSRTMWPSFRKSMKNGIKNLKIDLNKFLQIRQKLRIFKTKYWKKV